ncbi:hypothetical protein FRC11_013587, partial [Ceratobasidium sp. 423]
MDLEEATTMGNCTGVLNAVVKDTPKVRTSMTELKEIDVAISNGDNLPNTTASLEAKVQRRALLVTLLWLWNQHMLTTLPSYKVAVQHHVDKRNVGNGNLYMLASPTDVLLVYRMLWLCQVTRGYEPQNIRILVMGPTGGSSSYPIKYNIMDSLEWLFRSAESGDYRYFHFSGHGYAYEVEEGEGGVAARVRLVPPTTAERPEHPNSVIRDRHDCPSVPESRVKFYREALLTEWKYPSWQDRLKRQMKGPIKLDAENRIDAEEFNAMINKLPKGCMLTVTLDCFHGGRMYNINYKHEGPMFRGGIGWPTATPEGSQSITDPFEVYPSTSPHNLFVPPAFYLHSDFSFDPNVTMERVQGPDPLNGVQATVHVWSGYSTSLPQAGTFTSAFTSVVQQFEGDISQREMFQEISQRVDEATAGKAGRPLVQLRTPCDSDEV